MIQRILFTETNHIFNKRNLVTMKDRTGHYDLLECKCGVKGKCRNLISIEIESNKTKSQLCGCSLAPAFKIPDIIKITNCKGYGKIFSNLKPKTFHAVVAPPEDTYKNDFSGVWVQGAGEPVKVLNEEYERVSNFTFLSSFSEMQKKVIGGAW